MPRARIPSASPPLGEVKRVQVRLSDGNARAITKLLGSSVSRADVVHMVEEILGSHRTAVAISRGKIAATTPANVGVVLKNLRAAIHPFLDTSRGVDRDSYDLLHSTCAVLDELISRRMAELKRHRKIQSDVAELLDMTCPYLRLVWEKYSKDPVNRAARRRFVSAALSSIDVRHPDPDKHGADLDAHIDAVVLR
jgi:hypothetical protein